MNDSGFQTTRLGYEAQGLYPQNCLMTFISHRKL